MEWHRINAFSVDEFHAPGMPARDLYKHVSLKSVNVINYAAKDIEEERRRYEELINAHPPHISRLGIGISGHIALNKPGETDFEDSRRVRYVHLLEESKRQLELDPNFKALAAIPGSGVHHHPSHAHLGRGRSGRRAVRHQGGDGGEVDEGALSPELPASILRSKVRATLHLDPESAREIAPV